MAGETPADHHQDPQTPSSIDLPGWLRSAEKNSPRGTQRGHSPVAAPHRRPTAPAHPPERLPTPQHLVKKSCTVETSGADRRARCTLACRVVTWMCRIQPIRSKAAVLRVL